MKFRLLVDLEVFEFIKTLHRAEQSLLYRRFRQIQESPTAFTDYHEYAEAGYRVDINICDRFAISFAVDHMDRHIKILEVAAPDRK
jgi:hypothetical protein